MVDTKTPTPVQRIADLETQLQTVTAERDQHKGLAEKAGTDLKAEQTAHTATKDSLTKVTNELTTEKQSHADTKATLQKAQTDLTAKTGEYDTLKKDFDSRVQAEAARIAAENGHKPLPAAAAKKAGEDDTKKAGLK